MFYADPVFVYFISVIKIKIRLYIGYLIILTMMSILFFALILLGSTNAVVYQQGDTCGVNGEDYMKPNFTGSVAVAGNGCKLGNSTNCYCAPNITDGGVVGDFVWQCNGSVTFGPIVDKVCPDTIPIGSTNSTDPVPCNTTVNPTGFPGDPSCGYSECESGGDFSAICGCVDTGSSMLWICLQSTCGCGDDAATETDGGMTTGDTTDDEFKGTNSTSASVSTSFLLTTMQMIVAFTAAIVVMSSGL
jgi:hypothetical protein